MILFITTFVSVLLLSFQQQNVVHGKYKAAAFTSFLLAFTQYFMINAIVVSGLISVIYMGLGGAIGVTCSMMLHRYLFKH